MDPVAPPSQTPAVLPQAPMTPIQPEPVQNTPPLNASANKKSLFLIIGIIILVLITATLSLLLLLRSSTTTTMTTKTTESQNNTPAP